MAPKRRDQCWSDAEHAESVAEDRARRVAARTGGAHRAGRSSAFRGVTDEQIERLVEDRIRERVGGPSRRARRDSAREERAHVLVEDWETTELPEAWAAEVAGYDETTAARRELVAGRQARRLPAKVTAATAGAGHLAWGMGEVMALAGGGSTQTYVGLGAGALVAAGAAVHRGVNEARFRDSGPLSRWRTHYTVAAGLASTWVAGTVMAGPSWWGVAVLAAGAYGASVGWLRHHDVADTPPEPTPEPAAEPEPAPWDDLLVVDEASEFVLAWRERVAVKGGLVAGSFLTDAGPFAHGHQYTLDLADGGTRAEVQAKTEKLASVLRCDPLQLVLDDPEPDSEGWRDASRCVLRFVTVSPVRETVEHTASTYDDGWIGVGPYIDGEGCARYRLFGENSMWNGVVIGSTGSGKSALVNGLVASARSTGMVATLYLDPKGNSSPELARAATVSALGFDQVEAFVSGVERLLAGRKLESAAEGWSGFTPSPGRPGYLVVIDEVDLVAKLSREMADRLGAIAKQGRALGIALLVMTQVAQVQAFGGSELLRSNLAAGNVVLMRTATGGSGTLIAPALPDPKFLPQLPGYGYLQAPHNRPVPFRAFRLRSVQDCQDEGLPLDSWNVDTALRAYPDAPLDRIGQVALREVILAPDPETRAALHREKAALQLAVFLGDAEPTAEVGEPAVTQGPPPADVPAAWSVPKGAGASAFGPRPAPEPDLEIGPEPVPAKLTDNQAAVWRVLPADGSFLPTSAITDAAGMAGVRRDSTGKALASLEKRGHARRHTDGGAWARVVATGGVERVA